MEWERQNFCHFRPFFALLLPSPIPCLTNWKTKILKKWKNHLEMSLFDTSIIKITITWCMLYDACFLRYGVQQIFVMLDHFLSVYPTIAPKIKIWKKCKKTPGDIILHMCTINEDHMMYGSWDMKLDSLFVCLFVFERGRGEGGIFWPMTLLTTQKIKIFKNEKNIWRYYHFILAYHKWQSDDVWSLWK